MQSLPTWICTDAIPHDSATQQTRSRLHATNWRLPRISGCGWKCCGKISKGSSQRRKIAGSCCSDIKGRQGPATPRLMSGRRKHRMISIPKETKEPTFFYKMEERMDRLEGKVV